MPDHPVRPAAGRPAPGQRAAGVVLWVAGFAWWVAVPALLVAAVGESLTFLGEPVDADAAARSSRRLVAAAVVAVGLPLLGLAAAARVRSRAGAWFFVVLLVLGGALGAVVVRDADRSGPSDPAPRAPAVCQERSGGRTDCPGG